MPIIINQPQEPGVNKFMEKYSFKDGRIQDYIHEFLARNGYGERDAKGNLKRLHAIETGRLMRSLYWQAFTTSGGDRVVVEALYQHYGKFVELAVGRGEKYAGVESIGRKKWRPLHRLDGGKRMAKPFVTAEFRQQVRRFQRFMEREFAFQGFSIMENAVKVDQQKTK